jgi:hypothetical protein
VCVRQLPAFRAGPTFCAGACCCCWTAVVAASNWSSRSISACRRGNACRLRGVMGLQGSAAVARDVGAAAATSQRAPNEHRQHLNTPEPSVRRHDPSEAGSTRAERVTVSVGALQLPAAVRHYGQAARRTEQLQGHAPQPAAASNVYLMRLLAVAHHRSCVLRVESARRCGCRRALIARL